MSQYRVDSASVPWEAPISGLRCKTLQQGSRQLRVVEYTDAMEPHWCEKGHVGYVLHGRIEIRFDKETVVFEAGDGVFIPPGPRDRHEATVLSGTAGIVFLEEA